MMARKVFPHLLSDGDKQDASDGVADKCGDNLKIKRENNALKVNGQRNMKGRTYEYDDREYNNYAVERPPFKHAVNDAIHGVHQSARPDAVPESDTAHGQEHDRPRKLFKVVLPRNKLTSVDNVTALCIRRTFLRTPVAKKATIGMIAMIPISPIISWI